MRGIKSTIAAVGVIGLMVVVGSAASAPAANTKHGRPGPSSPMAAGQHQVQPATVLKARHLKTTALSTGNFGGSVPPMIFYPIDAVTTLTCPGTKTCTFEADQNVQARGWSSNNLWQICTLVDSNNMTEPNCPNLGYLTNGSYQAGSFTQSQSGLSPGSHTVQTFVYTDNGAEIGQYAIIYRVYTP